MSSEKQQQQLKNTPEVKYKNEKRRKTNFQSHTFTESAAFNVNFTVTSSCFLRFFKYWIKRVCLLDLILESGWFCFGLERLLGSVPVCAGFTGFPVL